MVLHTYMYEYKAFLQTQKYLNKHNLHWRSTPFRHFLQNKNNYSWKIALTFYQFYIKKEFNNCSIYTAMMIDIENLASNMNILAWYSALFARQMLPCLCHFNRQHWIRVNIVAAAFKILTTVLGFCLEILLANDCS